MSGTLDDVSGYEYWTEEDEDGNAGEVWVSVRKDVFDKMLEEINFLNALYAAGVDIWEGYEHAKTILEEEDEDGN